MKYLILLLSAILLVLTNCKTERHSYKKAFLKTHQKLQNEERIRFPFKGKVIYSYSKGDLIVSKPRRKLQFNKIGLWLDYDPLNENKILGRTEYDSSGYLNYTDVNGQDYGYDSLINIVECRDTLVNNQKMRACHYTWFHKNGTIRETYTNLWKGKTAQDGVLLHGWYRKYDTNGIVTWEMDYYLGYKDKMLNRIYGR
jgi:hypothetical protein